jgi:prostaglandin-H2 D-isomerase / glutathione transferase
VFPISITSDLLQKDYEDGRYNEIPDSFDANLGRMPVMKIGDDCLGQSKAINYYLATELFLMGSSTMEAAKIICIEESLQEMSSAYRSIVPYGVAPTPDQLNLWFAGGASDIEGPADPSGRGNRYAIWYLGRIEKLLGDTGYAVGGQLSLADVLIYNHLAEHLDEDQADSNVPSWKFGAFGNKDRTDTFLESYPKIKASINAIAVNENIHKWLNMRGVQKF